MFGGKLRARIAELEAEVARLENLPEVVAAVDTQRISVQLRETATEAEALRDRVARLERDLKSATGRAERRQRRLSEFLRNHPEVDPDDPRPGTYVRIRFTDDPSKPPNVVYYFRDSRDYVSVNHVAVGTPTEWYRTECDRMSLRIRNGATIHRDDEHLLEKRAREIEAWERRQLARELAELMYRPGGPGARAARQDFEEGSMQPLDE